MYRKKTEKSGIQNKLFGIYLRHNNQNGSHFYFFSLQWTQALLIGASLDTGSFTLRYL